MKDGDKNFSELVVLQAIDDDVHTGVQDKEEIGKVRENSAPEDTNIETVLCMWVLTQYLLHGQDLTYKQIFNLSWGDLAKVK